MKLFLQIMFAVFFGNLAALGVERYWDSLQAEKAEAIAAQKALADRQRKEQQGKILRELFQKGGRGGIVIPNPDEPKLPQDGDETGSEQ